jgi:NTE family protein
MPTKLLHSFALLTFLFFFQITDAQPLSKRANNPPTVGLVLSGGGAKGFAYVGLLKVLEEVNMPIDYIGGSSIGAVIGGLYSSGYSAEEIEELISLQDWDALIGDNFDREYISYEEKRFSDRYVFTIPIEPTGISIGRSLAGSFNIDLMLNRVFTHVAHVNDFSELCIPFFCIGTDLISGKDVVLDSGNIARAIRASMAIPGYFPPANYNGYYLTDGGVINNYPAEQLKEMGADIIIGGDVQSGLKTKQEDLTTITSILDQVVAFNRIDANEKGVALTDLYVHIPMPYSTMDFTEYDSIFAYGEKAANKHFSELQMLADSLNKIRSYKGNASSYERTDSIYVENILMRGINMETDKRFSGYFNEMDHQYNSLDKIEDRLKLLKGTNGLNGLHYKFNAYEFNKGDIEIYANNENKGSISAGLHADNVYHGSLLLNITLRNIRSSKAKLFTDVVVGQNPRLYSLFMVNNGFRPGIGAELDLFSFKFPLYQNDKRVNSLRMDKISGAVFVPLTIKNNFFFSAGAKWELFRLNQEIVYDTTLSLFGKFESYGVLYADMYFDNRDQTYFSTTGRVIDVKLKYVFPASSEWNKIVNSSTIIFFKYNNNLPLHKKIIFKPGIFAGYTIVKEDNLPTPFNNLDEYLTPPQHMFGFGGINPKNYLESHISFTGLRFIEKVGIYAAKFTADFQFNYYNKLYATTQFDVGFNEFQTSEITYDNMIYGGGLKLGYDSFIGPIEIVFMKSNLSSSLHTYFNLGFWF